MVSVGVIGCGHWGPNHIRIFSQISGVKVRLCSDIDQARLLSIKTQFPDIQTTKECRDVFSNPEIDAVCIATPTATHFDLVSQALQAGKHVLCEKPLSLKADECLELKRLADAKGKILAVGHIFLFNEGIRQIKEYIKSGELGNIYYAHSERTNLGPFRYDVNALWDLAPHDLAIFNYLFDATPLSVSARGQKCLKTSLEDLAFATLEYPKNILVNVHVSWLDPRKVRQITIVGDQKMIVWDDLDNLGPIKLYDKHVEKTQVFYQTYGEFQLLSKEGSITIPKVSAREPLKVQNQYFIESIEKKSSPQLIDAQKAYDVVRTLEAIQASMNSGGHPVKVE
jgi:predicted dehydrogenase